LSGNAFQLLTLSALTISAGLMMAVTGTNKKLLRWKGESRRCPICGQPDRRSCSCRR
jgi:hypothetical protein